MKGFIRSWLALTLAVSIMSAATIAIPFSRNITHAQATCTDIDLKFDSLPSAQGFTYFQSAGIPEANVFSVTGTSLIQNTIGIGLQNPNYALFGVVDGSEPFVLTVRARILAYENIGVGGPFGFFFDVRTATPNQEYAIGFSPSLVTDPLGNEVSIDTTVFHTYVLSATPGGNYTLDIDGHFAFGGPFSHTGGALNAIQLGDGNGTNANASAEITKFEFSQGCQITVSIDIKPGEDPAAINPSSTGVIPVAILSSNTFDATTVDPSSVKFGSGNATSTQNSIEDVDGDGTPDLVLHFPTQQTGIKSGDTQVCLTGKTTSGLDIMGCDTIQTVPPGS